MLSMQSRYALKALLYLARVNAPEPVSINQIAQAENIPRKFLEAILVQLKRQNIVSSKMGKAGGYTLARAAAQIDFAEVIRAIEGPIALLPCASKNFYRPCNDCIDEEACGLRLVMIRARDQILDVLERTTLADAIASNASADAIV